MSKLVLTDLNNLENENSTIATLAANNAFTETAIENTLSRDGSSPNQMEANLDMNSNRILNLPAPINDNEPARIIDVGPESVGVFAAAAQVAANAAIVATDTATVVADTATVVSSAAQVATDRTAVSAMVSGLVYNAPDYGWIGDGTDRSTQAQALINTVSAAGGGTINFPASANTYRADSKLTFPTYLTVGDGFDGQASIRLTGSGGSTNLNRASNPTASPAWNNNAATLDLRATGVKVGAGHSGGQGNVIVNGGSGFTDGTYTMTVSGGSFSTAATFHVTFSGGIASSVPTLINGGAYTTIPTNPVSLTGGDGTGVTANIYFDGAKIETTLSGGLEIDHLGFIDGGSANSTPFIQTTNTCLKIHDCTFYGSGNSWQDAIVLGGTLLTGGVLPQTIDSPFLGYGPTVIDNNNFTRLNRSVFFRGWCNGVIVSNNSINCSGTPAGFTSHCGMEIRGAGSAGAEGCIISGNLFEMGATPYGIIINNADNTTFINNAFWDPQAGFLFAYYFDGTNGANTIIMGLVAGTTSQFIGGGQDSINQCNVISATGFDFPNTGTSHGTVFNRFAGNSVILGTYSASDGVAGGLLVTHVSGVGGGGLNLSYDNSGYVHVDGKNLTTGSYPLVLQRSGGTLVVGSGTKTATASSGAATLNKVSGVITSEGLTTAAGSTYTLTITNSKIAAADQVFASVQLGTSTTGVPSITTVTPSSGQVVITIQNIHASAALNGTIKVAFFSVANT